MNGGSYRDWLPVKVLFALCLQPGRLGDSQASTPPSTPFTAPAFAIPKVRYKTLARFNDYIPTIFREKKGPRHSKRRARSATRDSKDECHVEGLFFLFWKYWAPNLDCWTCSDCIHINGKMIADKLVRLGHVTRNCNSCVFLTAGDHSRAIIGGRELFLGINLGSLTTWEIRGSLHTLSRKINIILWRE